MKEIIVGKNEEGKRLDKFLMQYLSKASGGFIYKMLRKKNIVLNDKKADGKEKLVKGDNIKLWLSDDTILKFANENLQKSHSGKEIDTSEYKKAYKNIKNIDIVYEDDNIILLSKPCGVLSQKASNDDISLNEWLVGYLLSKGQISADDLVTFKPSICNRLDRNTSGIVICSKTLLGARVMNELIKTRHIQKYYLTIADGIVEKDILIDGYLLKDEKTNTVKITKEKNDNASYIKTNVQVISINKAKKKSFLCVELITGKTHQIRAHLSSINHPLIGDVKYGDLKVNEYYRNTYGLKNQLLHSAKIVFPKELNGEFEKVAGMSFEAELPAKFKTIKKDLFGE